MGIELEALPLIYRISDKVIRILGCNPSAMTLQGTNTYLIGTGKRRVLIDAGDEVTAPKYIDALRNVLKQERATIEHLIVTHWHHDHLGGVDAVQEFLERTAKPAIVWKLQRNPEDRHFSELEKTVKWEPLRDEQLVEVEGAKLRIKHTPGHTTDHACVLLEDDNTLFSGDCILGQGTTVFENLYDYMRSLKKILDLKPKTIYPGHGPVVLKPGDIIQTYINHRNMREREILSVIQSKGPISEQLIVEEIYKDVVEELKTHCVSNVLHHLEKLLTEGKVAGKPGKWEYLQ